MTRARRMTDAPGAPLTGTRALAVLWMGLMSMACADAGQREGGAPVGGGDTMDADPVQQQTPEPGIPFDPARTRPGDVAGDMVLERIFAERTVVDSTHFGTARFAGLIELSGRAIPHFDADMRGQSVCFEADSASAAHLPRWRHDERRPWFCFANPDEATLLEEGSRATIVIDRFTIQRNLSDAVNSAHLASVVRVAGSGADRYEQVSCDGLEREILAVEPTRRALGAASGARAAIAVATEPNRHVQGATDSLFTVRYRDIVVHIRRPAGGRDLAEHVSITGSRWVRIPGLGIGVPASQIVAILGEPTERRPEALVYDCGEHTEQPVTFILAGDTVVRIEIAYYVD